MRHNIRVGPMKCPFVKLCCIFQLNIFHHLLFQVMELNKCESKSDAAMKSSTIALGVSLGISVLVGIFFLPLLIYHLTGQRRAYLVIQQTCFITYLIMELTPQLLLSRDRFSKLLFSSMAFLNEELKEMAPETNYSYTVIHLK